MKNETSILREWLDHYRWQGVDRIFLIDNGSTDDQLRILEKDIAEGFVEFFPRARPHTQNRHYRELFSSAKIRRKVEWLAMADLDKFWYSPLGDLKRAIATLDRNVDLVYSNWVAFGSSGLVEQPTSVRSSFIRRQPQLGSHSSTKWICRTDQIGRFGNFDQHKVGGVDSRRVVFDNDAFRLNHYVLQSLEHFTSVKMTRGDVSSPTLDSARDIAYFRHVDDQANVLDRTLADMVTRHPSSKDGR